MDEEPAFPQFLYIKTLEEELHGDLRDDGEAPDKYWEQGWFLTSSGGKRINFDDYHGVYEKAFPTRYRLDEFSLTKSQRRVLARNKDLRYVIRPLRITPGKESLNYLHNISRFGTPPKDTLTKQFGYILLHPAELMELCVFCGDELVAFSIFEVGQKALWGTIGVWSPRHPHRSLGTLTILKEMQYAVKNELDYYYMGHFYLANPSYSYKMNFNGLELYDWDNERWVRFGDPYISDMVQQRLPRKR